MAEVTDCLTATINTSDFPTKDYLTATINTSDFPTKDYLTATINTSDFVTKDCLTATINTASDFPTKDVKVSCDEMAHHQKLLSAFLVKGWTLTGLECKKCKRLPSICLPGGRPMCVSCDSENIAWPSLWDMPTINTPGLLAIPSLFGSTTSSTVLGPEETCTINLTGTNNPNISNIDKSIKQPLLGANNKSLSSTNTIATNPNISTSVTDDSVGARSCLNFGVFSDPDDTQPFEYHRQGHMPLHMIMASRALSEASGMLSSTLPFIPRPATVVERLPSVMQTLDKAQSSMVDVVDKLTGRLQMLVTDDSVESSAKINQNLEVLNRSLDVMSHIEDVRNNPGKCLAPPS